MTREAIIATTEIDRHGMAITEEGLRDIAGRMATGPCCALIVDHDPTLPPFGKFIEGRVEVRNGELALIALYEHLRQVGETTMPDGTAAIVLQSAGDNRPFVSGAEVEELRIESDPMTFSDRSADSFFDGIESECGFAINDQGLIARKALISPAIVIVTVGGFLARRFMERVSDAALDKVWAVLRAAVPALFREAISPGDTRYVVFRVSGEPAIDFCAASGDGSAILGALLDEAKMNAAVSQARKIAAAIPAQRIQFLMTDDGGWIFNFLLTNDGRVYGSRDAFRRLDERLASKGIQREDS